MVTQSRRKRSRLPSRASAVDPDEVRVPHPDRPQPAGGQAEQAGVEEGGGGRLVGVEDDEVDVMNVKRAFEKNHIMNPLYLAANGIEAQKMNGGFMSMMSR